MIRRIAYKLKNRLTLPRYGAAPPLERTTYLEDGNQWYVPAMVGPSTFTGEVVGAAAVRRVLAILGKLSRDPYMDFVIGFYERGLDRFGEQWVYSDINTVLLGLTRLLNVQNYLEIGVRRGRSMAMVASQAPCCRIAGFDLWMDNYAGMENPGGDFVCTELERVGFQGKVEFLDGDSKQTVPQYVQAHPDTYFDLVTVDGDHSLEGARADLNNVIPRLKVGGALVFDDVSHQEHPYLGKLWDEFIARDLRFASWSFKEVGFGVAFAIRKY